MTLLESLIDYIKVHHKCGDHHLDDYGFGMVILNNKAKEKELIISVDEDVKGDCKFKWYIKYKNAAPTKITHSNFAHLTNTVIRLFMEA